MNDSQTMEGSMALEYTRSGVKKGHLEVNEASDCFQNFDEGMEHKIGKEVRGRWREAREEINCNIAFLDTPARLPARAPRPRSLAIDFPRPPPPLR